MSYSALGKVRQSQAEGQRFSLCSNGMQGSVDDAMRFSQPWSEQTLRHCKACPAHSKAAMSAAAGPTPAGALVEPQEDAGAPPPAPVASSPSPQVTAAAAEAPAAAGNGAAPEAKAGGAITSAMVSWPASACSFPLMGAYYYPASSAADDAHNACASQPRLA